jgi:hypothetical protein
MALAADWITIPSKICTDLSITYGQWLSVLELKTINPHLRGPFKVEDDKVDMLSLIPPTAGNGYPIYVDEHEKAGESWLSVWYHHSRGAARQIELKRYVDISKLGQLLGQLQAEGNKKCSAIVFKNSSISEHADFVTGLRELGLSSANIHGRCIFNPNRSSPQDVRKYSETYEKATCIAITSCDEIQTMKGAIAADTYVRSTILAKMLLFAMDEVRRGAIQNELLRQNFLAKLLSGDGTLDARKTQRRLDVRLVITDQNVISLQDYAEILSSEGFKPKVRQENITVRAYCTWLNLLRLYQIGAFKNSKNWIKLLCSITIAIRGTQNRGYRRIQELSNQSPITSHDACIKYGIGRRAANLWIGTMRREGLMERLLQVPGSRYHSYAVTSRGKEISKLLDAIDRDYREICFEKGVDDPETILERIKEKLGPRSTEEGPEAR